MGRQWDWELASLTYYSLAFYYLLTSKFLPWEVTTFGTTTMGGEGGTIPIDLTCVFFSSFYYSDGHSVDGDDDAIYLPLFSGDGRHLLVSDMCGGRIGGGQWQAPGMGGPPELVPVAN